MCNVEIHILHRMTLVFNDLDPSPVELTCTDDDDDDDDADHEEDGDGEFLPADAAIVRYNRSQ